MGYHRAGFEVFGIDVEPQPNYPFTFHQHEALWLLEKLVEGQWEGIGAYDAIHASPPCQFYASLSDSAKHWRSIPPVRELLEQTGLPYVIENIADAAWDMREPVRLCGSMFGLGVRRHRMFETTLPMFMQPPCAHEYQGEIRAYYGKPGWAAWTPKGANVQKKGRKPLLRGSVELAPADMGIDWMTWDELREAIPPAYTEFIGTQLLAHVAGRAVA